MAITITNTGADTFITDGSQNPSFNKNFIAGLTKATAINNPITGGLDSVLVLDNTNRSIVMPYSDITDINGSTPAALGLLDASQVASYLNNNFFDFGNGGLTTVATSFPLTGDGTLGNPVTLEDGTNTGDIPIWDASGPNWVIQPNPSWNLEARRNVKTFTFAGGFNLSGGGFNGSYLMGTPFLRRSSGGGATATMSTGGAAGHDPIVQISSQAGSWQELTTPLFSGSYFNIQNTSNRKYYARTKFRASAIAGGGSLFFCFGDSPATTMLNGFGFEIVGGTGLIRSFCNTGASFKYGTSTTNIVAGTWYDAEFEYVYTGGNMVCRLFLNGILISTATKPVGAFNFNSHLEWIATGPTNNQIVHTDLIEYSIYG